MRRGSTLPTTSGRNLFGWSGAASGDQNPLTGTMNSNKVITASFTKRPWVQDEGNPDLLSQTASG